MEIQDLSKILKDHTFVEGMTPEQVEFLAGCAKNMRVDAGEYLVREGSEANQTLLVRRGRVALEIHAPGKGPARVQTVEPGEVIGWSWLFPPYRWHFDARALESTLVLAFDGACLRKKCEDDHDLGYAFLKRLVRTIHDRLERTRVQLLDVYGKEYDHGGP